MTVNNNTEIEDQKRVEKGSLNWPYLLCVLVLTILFAVILYWDTVNSIAKIWWRSDTYAHGVLIAPISMYMIYSRWRHIVSLTPAINTWALVVLVLLTMTWIFAHAANVLFVQQLALVAMVIALMSAMLGTTVIKSILFPLAYLFFMVPIGDSFTPIMQDFTAFFTVKSLQLTGIPVHWEGRYFSIPTGKFEVAEACSGVRYLIASVALGCLYAYLTYNSYLKRSVFIAFCVVVPILANVIRAYGIVMLAYLSDMKLAVGVDHIIYGWLFFGLVMFLLFWIGSYWRDPRGNMDDINSSGHVPELLFYRKSKLALMTTAILLVVSAGPTAAMWFEKNAEMMHEVKLIAPKVLESQYNVADDDNDSWYPIFQGASNEGRWVYISDSGKIVHLYIAYYAKEHEDSELISSENSIYDGKKWVRTSDRHQKVTLTNGRELGLVETQIQNRSETRLVWHWYIVSTVQTDGNMAAKLAKSWSILKGEQRGAAVVAIAANYPVEAQEARDTLLEFADRYSSIWDPKQFWDLIVDRHKYLE